MNREEREREREDRRQFQILILTWARDLMAGNLWEDLYMTLQSTEITDDTSMRIVQTIGTDRCR